LSPGTGTAASVPATNLIGEETMASEKWRMKGQWLKNCNCAYGCPCDFNALPTRGGCQGMAAMKIEKGHFDDSPSMSLLPTSDAVHKFVTQ
jgi:hypothetical protein